jgi:hypothetical protein
MQFFMMILILLFKFDLKLFLNIRLVENLSENLVESLYV